MLDLANIYVWQSEIKSKLKDTITEIESLKNACGCLKELAIHNPETYANKYHLMALELTKVLSSNQQFQDEIQVYNSAELLYVRLINAATPIIPDLIIEVTFKQSRTLIQLAEYQNAVDTLERLLLYIDEYKNHISEDCDYLGSKCLNNIAVALFYMNRVEEAKNNFEKAVELRESLAQKYGDQKYLIESIEIRMSIGFLCFENSDFKLAINIYSELVFFLKKNPELTGMLPFLAEAFDRLGHSYCSLNQISDGLESFDRAMEIYIKIGSNRDDRNEINSKFLELLIAIALNRFKIYDASCLAYFEKSIVLVNEVKNYNPLLALECEAYFIATYAHSLERFANGVGARSAYQRAIYIYTECLNQNIKDYRMHLVISLNGLAYILFEQGDYEECIKLCNNAIGVLSGISKTSHDHENEMFESLRYLGLAYSTIGNYRIAIESYLKALNISQSENLTLSKQKTAEIYCALANVYSNIRKTQSAESFYIKSIVIYEEIAAENEDEQYNAGYLSTLHNYAVLCRLKKRYNEAANIFLKILNSV